MAHQTKATETPYVVLLKAFTNLAANGGRGDWAEVQDCWTFEHANEGQVAIALDDDELPLTNSHNVRASTLTFHIPHAGVCHGLGGYFEAHLFGSVTLSIHPDPARATREMMSWFPIFFPFKVSFSYTVRRSPACPFLTGCPFPRSPSTWRPTRSWTSTCGG